MTAFKVRGVRDGVGRSEVSWSEEEGFRDPGAVTAAMILAGDAVCASPTGPCFDAAVAPAVVALITAMRSFEWVEAIEAPPELMGELRRLQEVPDGAIA